jgi:uncharacterized membrane protein
MRVVRARSARALRRRALAAAGLGAALGAGCAGAPAPVAGSDAGRAEAALHAALPRAEAERARSVRAWICDGELAIATEQRRDSDALVLVLPEGAVALRREGSAGARWAAEGLAFTSQDGEAVLENAEGEWRRCREDPRRAPAEAAKLRGVEFRATGNEPGWVLEISAARIVFVTDHGETRVELPTPEPSADPRAAATRYRAAGSGHELVVTLHERRCTDAMTGELSGSSVEVTLDGRVHRGCGQSLH